MLQELKDSEILLLWGHGRSHKAGKEVRMEDSAFTWVSIHNGVASGFKDYPQTWLPSTKEAVEIDKARW